jgi:hypothetical protein
MARRADFRRSNSSSFDSELQLLSRRVDPDPHGVDRHLLPLRDLMPAEAFELEQQERCLLRRRERRKQSVQEFGLLLGFQLF